MKLTPLAALAALSLAACASTGANTPTYHTAVKVNGVAVNINQNSGVTGGQFSITVDRVPRTIPNGQAQDTASLCGGTDATDTYTNLNVKGTATATTVPAGASGNGIASPSISVATGDVSANGCAAIVAAAATTAHPADTVAAALNHTALPAASAGSIVRDGVAPPAPPASH